MTALIVCSRFSAWSKTIECCGLEDLVGDLQAVHAVGLEDLLADLGLAVVEGRQAVQELDLRVARCARTTSALTWYGVSSSIRSSQTLLSSPIDTHTSV